LSATRCTNVTERLFLDTNVVVYLLAEDPAKAARAETLLVTRPCVSTQVVNEFINVCMKKLGFSRAAAHENARALMTQCDIAPLTAVTIERAMRLGERHGFSHWDALIVAAAQLAGCSVLMTEDMQDGLQLDGLRLMNPFAESRNG
jgi:predicted nucleic acid-binding protein